MSETPIAGLVDDLAKARAGAAPKPVTVEDCIRTLAALKDHSCIVDRATHIRCYELLLTKATLYAKPIVAVCEGEKAGC